MTTRFWWCVCAAGLVGALAATPLGCTSSDESTTATTTTTTHTTTHSGGQGGIGATGGGGQGASGGVGGGVSASQTFCEDNCPASVACGQGGAGGGSSSWPPTLQDCMDVCVVMWEDCSPAVLAAALACADPNVDPNCDIDAFWTCLGADAACVQMPGSGSGGNG